MSKVRCNPFDQQASMECSYRRRCNAQCSSSILQSAGMVHGQALEMVLWSSSVTGRSIGRFVSLDQGN